MSTLIEEEQTVFKYTELSQRAKERAHENWCYGQDYSWADEAMASLKALPERFGGRLSDWSVHWQYGCGHSYATFEMPDDWFGDYEENELFAEAQFCEAVEQLGPYDPVTLRGDGDCKLTGYDADEAAIDGLRKEFFAGERDLNKLMQAAFDSWLEYVQSDYEYQISEESFADACEANEYEFDEDGNLV